jgi:DNA-binding XRE family transcriptional regulator
MACRAPTAGSWGLSLGAHRGPPAGTLARKNYRPVGRTAAQAAASRAARSEEYRAARDEYARLRELRKTNPIAAHLRERRFELGLTQQEVATAAGTSHTATSRLESAGHTPNLETLRKIAPVARRGAARLLSAQR